MKFLLTFICTSAPAAKENEVLCMINYNRRENKASLEDNTSCLDIFAETTTSHEYVKLEAAQVFAIYF